MRSCHATYRTSSRRVHQMLRDRFSSVAQETPTRTNIVHELRVSRFFCVFIFISDSSKYIHVYFQLYPMLLLFLYMDIGMNRMCKFNIGFVFVVTYSVRDFRQIALYMHESCGRVDWHICTILLVELGIICRHAIQLFLAGRGHCRTKSFVPMAKTSSIVAIKP